MRTYRNRINANLRVRFYRAGTADAGRYSYDHAPVPAAAGAAAAAAAPAYTGSLDFSTVAVRKREFTFFSITNPLLDTLAINVMDARPTGQGLGNILVYYVASRAVLSGVEYVIALNVVPQANMFYQRLGFRPYRSKASVYEGAGWVAGNDQQAWYANFRQTQRNALVAANTVAAQNEVINATMAVTNTFANNHMFVDAVHLQTTALAATLRNWQAE